MLGQGRSECHALPFCLLRGVQRRARGASCRSRCLCGPGFQHRAQALSLYGESVLAKIRFRPSVPVACVEKVSLDAVQQRMDCVEDRFPFVGLRNLVGPVPTRTGLETGLGDQAEGFGCFRFDGRGRPLSWF